MRDDDSNALPALGAQVDIPSPDRLQSLLREAQARALENTPLPEPTADENLHWDAPPPELVDSLAGFKIIDTIDQGGQGIVYKARHEQTGQFIAVKVLRNGRLSSRSERSRFEREIQTLAKLKHPNIVKFIPHHNNSPFKYFCMEFIEGEPVDAFVFQRRLSVRDVVQMTVKICDAVQSAHQAMVLHRDLKPANVLVTSDGEPHVLDFGLSRDLDAEMRGLQSRVSNTDQRVGTLVYSSPEQVDERAGEVDTRTDVYALGIMLYELLTGCKPYPVHGSTREVIDSITTATPRSLRRIVATTKADERWTNGAISDDLEKVILKALEKEQTRRYQSVEALKDDLQRYLRGDPVTAKSASYGYLLGKLITRYKLASGLAAALLLTVLAGSISVSVVSQQKLRIMRISQEASAISGLLNQGRYLSAQGNFSDGSPALEKVLELGRASKSNDPTIKSNMFDAAYTLALQSARQKERQKCDQYLADMERIANDSFQQNPQDPAALRQMALFHFVKGENFTFQRKPKSATANYEKSVSFREKLCSIDPNNRNYKIELIKSIDGLGGCFCNFKNTSAAFETFSRAQSIINDYLLKEPEDFDVKLELAANEGLFAAAHIYCNTAAHDRLARDLISQQKQRLESLCRDPRGAYRGVELYNLLNSIPTKLQVIAENQAKRPPIVYKETPSSIP